MLFDNFRFLNLYTLRTRASKIYIRILFVNCDYAKIVCRCVILYISFRVILMFEFNVNSYLYSYTSNVFNLKHSKVLLSTKLNVLVFISYNKQIFYRLTAR